MKNLKNHFSLLIILFLVFISVGCQDKKEEENETEPEQELVSPQTIIDLAPGKKYIVLLVNTAYADSLPNADAKEFCSFPLQNEVPDSLYTTDVFPGDSVIWIGVSTTAPIDDKVEINMINHRGGQNVLGPQRGEKGMVKGKIKDDPSFVGQQESYRIKFKITTAGNDSRNYNLDPILRVH